MKTGSTKTTIEGKKGSYLDPAKLV